MRKVLRLLFVIPPWSPSSRVPISLCEQTSMLHPHARTYYAQEYAPTPPSTHLQRCRYICRVHPVFLDHIWLPAPRVTCPCLIRKAPQPAVKFKVGIRVRDTVRSTIEFQGQLISVVTGPPGCGLGVRVWGLGFRVCGIGFGVLHHVILLILLAHPHE